ncbi:hypothetical protein [Coralloluteibacterium thermophilus]|uniref:DUF2974 domain-containing protein n=1 Tax=Coralloluteibacterium thermophilum TaxID=2707049 RepID=A0ABV9NLF4_9GAMM
MNVQPSLVSALANRLPPLADAGAARQAAQPLPASGGRHVPEPDYNPQLQGLLQRAFGAVPAANVPASFDAQVRGQEPRPIDMDLARICADVHDTASTGIDGWTRLGEAELLAAGIDPASLDDPSTGFRAALYQDDGGNTVLVFGGSNDVRDWITNFRQGLGVDDVQYNQAVALAVDAKAAFGDDLVITGTSLGGGLASTAAMATGSAAVTFNASGVNGNTLERLGLDPAQARAEAADGQIRRYSVEGELLTKLQEENIATRGLMPDAIGHRITVDDPAPLSFWEKLIPGRALAHEIDLHMIHSVIASFEQSPPW